MTAAHLWVTVHPPRSPGARRAGRGAGALVEGLVVYDLERPAKPGETLTLLDFAGFLQRSPTELDALTLAGILSGPFDPGALTVRAWSGSAKPRREGPRGDLVLALEPGVTAVSLRYRVEVPRRDWPFGCAHRRCSLSGAVAPLPSAPARGGSALPATDRVIAPVRWTVHRADFPPAWVCEAEARDLEIVVAAGDGDVVHYPSVFFGPRWRRSVDRVAGVRLEVLHVGSRPSGRAPHETFLQLRRDTAGNVLEIAGELALLMQRLGLRPRPDTLTVVEGPLHSEVAQAHPHVVMVSDQALEIFPIERLLKFHQEAIARALADALVSARVVELHRPSVGLWLPGQMAFALLEVWRGLRDHRDEYAADILRNLTFVPAVDRFLYTQQASFAQTYFRGIEDRPPLRNHPLWFSHGLPTGRRIHEKLVDTLDPAQRTALRRQMFAHPDADPIAAAERAYGRTLGWFYDQWLGPYPAVDYAVAEVRTEAVEGGFRHEIDLARRADRPLVEPVQVLAEERGGEQHFLLWNGELAPGRSLHQQPASGTYTFVLYTERRLDHVRLDPRNRLVQEALPPRENVDPQFNDRKPPAFRFLYTGAGFSVAASELFGANSVAGRFNAFSAFVAFEGSLRRDLRREGQVFLAHDRESHISGSVATNFAFGAKVTPQRRRARVRLLGGASWLNPRSLDPAGGVRFSQRLALIDDTRRFTWWPDRGRRLELGVTARQTVRVDGRDDHRFDLGFDAEWVELVSLAHEHVLALRLRLGVVVPIASEPEFRALERVGGIGGLSGYAADEIFGLAVGSAQLEYRHVFLRDLPINLLHAGYLRSIGGVVFAGLATSSACDSLDGWFGGDRWYAQVGYGLTAQLSVLGVTPQLLRVEAAVPLVRRLGVPCLGETLPDLLAERQGLDDPARLLAPVNVNVLLAQPF